MDITFPPNTPEEQKQATQTFFDTVNTASDEELTVLVQSGNICLTATTKNLHGATVTPLHWAAMGGKTETALALIAQGANLHTMDNEAITAIDSINSGSPILSPQIIQLTARYDQFVQHKTPPQSAREVYHLLACVPLVEPRAPVPRENHLKQIFMHANWHGVEKETITRIVGELRKSEPDYLCDELLAIASPPPPRRTLPTTTQQARGR